MRPTWSARYKTPYAPSPLVPRLTAAVFAQWHVGVQSLGQTPFGRGFDTSKHYYDGAEDHWTQAACCSAACNTPCTENSPRPDIGPYMHAAGLSNPNMIDFWCSECSNGRLGLWLVPRLPRL